MRPSDWELTWIFFSSPLCHGLQVRQVDLFSTPEDVDEEKASGSGAVAELSAWCSCSEWATSSLGEVFPASDLVTVLLSPNFSSIPSSFGSTNRDHGQNEEHVWAAVSLQLFPVTVVCFDVVGSANLMCCAHGKIKSWLDVVYICRLDKAPFCISVRKW